jgi:hypothetical protein
LANMTEGFEIVSQKAGDLHRLKVKNSEGVQLTLQQKLSEGHQILEVRPLRGSLEDAFIEKALRKGGQL